MYFYFHTEVGSFLHITERSKEAVLKTIKTIPFPVQVNIKDGKNFKLVYAHIPAGTEDRVKGTNMSAAMQKQNLKPNTFAE
jgi:hypothetical protein